MSLLSRFRTIDDGAKARAVRRLVEDATPDFDFFFMIVLAVLMATFGLLAGSETVVVGSMLIAPILYPVLGLSLGISMSDPKVIRRSLVTVGKAAGLAVASAAAATILFSFGEVPFRANEIIIARTSPSLLFLVVAIASGIAVAYALAKPKLSETLPGVAVSVALIPPLAVVGVGLVWLNVAIVAGAAMMFIVNVLGIVGAGMLIFSLMDVREERLVANQVIAKEQKRVEEEEEVVKKADEETERSTFE